MAIAIFGSLPSPVYNHNQVGTNTFPLPAGGGECLVLCAPSIRVVSVESGEFTEERGDMSWYTIDSPNMIGR